LVLRTETECVYCAVRAKSLRMIEANVFLWTIKVFSWDILPWSLVSMRRLYRLWILWSRLLYASQ